MTQINNTPTYNTAAKAILNLTRNKPATQSAALKIIMNTNPGSVARVTVAVERVITTGATAAAKRGQHGDVTAMMKFNSALKLLAKTSGLNPHGAIQRLATTSLTT